MSEASLKDYEIILIASPDLNAEALTQLQSQFGEMVTRQGGRVVETVALGKRKLSYRIGKHHEGHYLQLKLQLPPSGVDGLKRAAALSESLVRMMVVQATGTAAPLLKTDAAGPELEA